jgi:hypothetical protein
MDLADPRPKRILASKRCAKRAAYYAAVPLMCHCIVRLLRDWRAGRVICWALFVDPRRSKSVEMAPLSKLMRKILAQRSQAQCTEGQTVTAMKWHIILPI